MIEICDSSAILAFLKAEPGYEKVKKLFEDACEQKFTVFIHQINYVEVLKKLLQYYGETHTKKTIASLVQPFFGVSNLLNEEMAMYINQFLKHPGVSVADGVGLSFAKVMEGRFWTADRALKDIAKKGNVQLVLIRN